MRGRSIKTLRNSLYCALCLLATIFLLSHAQGGLLVNVEEQGWEEIIFDGKKPNRYSTCGESCVQIKTESSVLMIG
jgi:hypothetical protein